MLEDGHLSSDWLTRLGRWHILFRLLVIASLKYKTLDLPEYKSAWQCGGHQFDPWSGKIPHAVEQLSPCSTTIDPKLGSLRAAATKACLPRACALRQGKPPQ